MIKFKKFLFFLVYGISVTAFCLYQHHQMQSAMEEIQPYSHYHSPTETEFFSETETFSSAIISNTESSMSLSSESFKETETKLKSAPSETSLKTTEPKISVTESVPITEATEIQFPIELNHATFEELCAIPEIGEVTAQKIIDYRNQHDGFLNCQQLLEISGIGEHKYQTILPYLYLETEYFPEAETTEMPEATETPETAEILETTEPTESPEENISPEIPLLNLNTVTKEQLMLLPDCDEALAEEIIHLRDEEIHVFYNILEITLAEHVTTALFAEWSDYLVVDDDGSTQIPYIPPYAQN